MIGNRAKINVDDAVDACQTLVLETLGNLYLRFACQYRGLPYLIFITAWADRTPLCTKWVECVHRSNSAVARSKGPSKASMSDTIADGVILQRLQTFHADALGKSRAARRGSMKIKRCPLLNKCQPEGQTLGRQKALIGK